MTSRLATPADETSDRRSPKAQAMSEPDRKLPEEVRALPRAAPRRGAGDGAKRRHAGEHGVLV